MARLCCILPNASPRFVHGYCCMQMQTDFVEILLSWWGRVGQDSSTQIIETLDAAFVIPAEFLGSSSGQKKLRNIEQLEEMNRRVNWLVEFCLFGAPLFECKQLSSIIFIQQRISFFFLFVSICPIHGERCLQSPQIKGSDKSKLKVEESSCRTPLRRYERLLRTSSKELQNCFFGFIECIYQRDFPAFDIGIWCFCPVV